MSRDGQRGQLDDDLTSKYEVLDLLGGGGMGRVLRARHRQLKRWVAIKLLHQEVTTSEAVTRFMREARAAAQIRSPHVAHVLDAGILRSGQPYIVMEFLEGQDLARMIAAKGRLPVGEAVGYLLEALDAIAEAHALQIIHRDIKPGNLFATRIAGGETAIKVVDFGLAKTSQSLDTLDPGVTERGAVLGTPSYMSPEQFVNAQDVDARADIWGLGATLFELLTGAAPFAGTNLPQVYSAVMHQPIPTLRKVLPELPPGLEQVVATCLTREREQRYKNVAELAIALEPYAASSARMHVERINRVIAGAATLPPFEEEPESPDSPALVLEESGEKPVFSSTFERERSLPADTRPHATRERIRSARVLWIGVSLLAALAAALALWTAREPNDDTSHSPATTVRSSAAPERPVSVATTEAGAEAPAPDPNTIEPPINTAVTQTTPAPKPAPSKKRSRKAAHGADSTKPSPASLYEKYP